MTLKNSQKKRIEKMAREGKTFSFICYKLFGNYKKYDEVHAHCWASGCLSWQGAKKMISNRLKSLRRKRISPEEKEQAIQEIGEYVEYLYKCGNDLQVRLDRVRKALI